MSYMFINVDLLGPTLDSKYLIENYVTRLANTGLYSGIGELINHVRAHIVALGELNEGDAELAISEATLTDEFFDRMSRLQSLEAYVLIKVDVPATTNGGV